MSEWNPQQKRINAAEEEEKTHAQLIEMRSGKILFTFWDFNARLFWLLVQILGLEVEVWYKFLFLLVFLRRC